MAKHKFKTGEWVRIHKAGVWQVYRMLRVKCLDPVTQSKVERDILFVKRFVTNSFRKSFGQECCAPELAKRLSASDEKKLDSLNIEPELAEAQRVPNTTVSLTDDELAKVYKLIETLEDDDDVQKVYHNIEIKEEQMSLL